MQVGLPEVALGRRRRRTDGEDTECDYLQLRPLRAVELPPGLGGHVDLDDAVDLGELQVVDEGLVLRQLAESAVEVGAVGGEELEDLAHGGHYLPHVENVLVVVVGREGEGDEVNVEGHVLSPFFVLVHGKVLEVGGHPSIIARPLIAHEPHT